MAGVEVPGGFHSYIRIYMDRAHAADQPEDGTVDIPRSSIHDAAWGSRQLHHGVHKVENDKALFAECVAAGITSRSVPQINATGASER